MRWIDRGPEPQGVQEYARQFTQGWIDFFQNRVAERPRDSRWGDFRDHLGRRSDNLCWYCERLCQRNPDDSGKAPTVDHFRPLSRFPDLSYQWSNWIFSCYRCNADNKRDGWPPLGYVDPSATAQEERPDQFFDYDADTGDIIPRSGLSSETRVRVFRTIDDLGLNKVDVRFYRWNWVRQFVDGWHSLPIGERPAFAEFSTRLGIEFAGATSMMVHQLTALNEP